MRYTPDFRTLIKPTHGNSGTQFVVEIASDEEIVLPTKHMKKPSTRVTAKIPMPSIKTEAKGKASQKMAVDTKCSLSGNKVRIVDLPDFAQGSSWRTLFLPTLYDRFFASNEPFTKFIKGSQSFTAFVQTNINLVYPEIGYKVTSTDAIHSLVCFHCTHLSYSDDDLWTGIQSYQWETIQCWFHGSQDYKITH